MGLGQQQKPMERVAAAIAGQILEGRYAPNDLLPPYRTLAKEFSVSPASITRAITRLEKAEIVERFGRRGVVVKARRERAVRSNRNARLEHVNFIMPQGIRSVPHNESTALAGYSDAMEIYDLKSSLHLLPFSGSDSYDQLTESDFMKLLSARMPWENQGCVMFLLTCPKMMAWFQESGISFVLQYSDQYRRDLLPEHHSVFVNKHIGTTQAAQHVLELGHRRIAYVGTIHPHPYRIRALEGYRNALQAWGVDPRPKDMVELCAEWPEDAVAPLRRVLEQPDRPTAILCSNDAIAIGALRAAHELEMRVPEDLSIVGFGDEAEALRCDPPLATVQHPRRAAACAAVEMLVKVHQDEPAEFQTRILQTRLIARGGTGPAPKGRGETGRDAGML